MKKGLSIIHKDKEKYETSIKSVWEELNTEKQEELESSLLETIFKKTFEDLATPIS